MKVAQVAVLVTTGQRFQLFDYLVPEEYQAGIKIGSKATVPFASRLVHGYVWGLASESQFPNLREINELEPEELWLSPQQLALALWISDYYLVPVSQALETMVPGAFQGKYRLYYRLGCRKPEPGQLRPDVLKIYAYIDEKGKPVSRQELLNQFNSRTAAALDELVSNGLLVKEHSLTSSTVRAKRLKAYQPSGTLIERVTPLQSRVFDFLSAIDYPASYPEIKEMTGASRSVVSTLVQKGLLQEVEVTQNRRPLEMQHQTPKQSFLLTADQEQVYRTIAADLENGKFRAHLLHGVTGSGKTEIYKRLAQKSLERGKSALVLVPEISLTPQMAAQFGQLFGDRIAILHSRMSTGERFDEWNRIRTGEAKVVLGARSAVFAPLKELGLVVVDEEHENSYKQGEAPHYHAVKVAEVLARETGAVLVLGSATPSVATYYAANQGRLQLHTLGQRVGGGSLPAVEVCDMRQELKAGNRSIFSRVLSGRIEAALARREQVILFLNRRGYAAFVLCRSCGHVIKCGNCQVSMTVHRATPRLSCHYCDAESPLPKTCPECGSQYIRDFGIGTERVEQEVTKAFPQAKAARLDREASSRKGRIPQILSEFRQGKLDILVGTQMVAKGLDFPNVTVVGVMAADISLNLPDFSSGERTFQLVNQVAGRAGRGTKKGSVVVQTYNPDHYSITAAAAHDYQDFVRHELPFRRRLNYPPFSDMVLLSLSSPQDEAALHAGEKLESQLKAGLSEVCRVSPVHPAAMPRIRGRYRYQITLRWAAGADHRADWNVIYRLCSELPSSHTEDVRVSIDVDPVSLL